MTLATPTRTRSKRERLRSRFHVAALLCALALLGGCSRHWGLGIAELPYDRGWRTLPIGAWVLNDGLAAKTMSFCPRETCVRQGFAALLSFEGREADALERMLASDPARLARDFAKPAPPRPPTPLIGQTGKPRPAPPGKPRSATSVSRFGADGANGLLVEIRALDAGGKLAATAILSGREGGRLILALGVSPDPDAARQQARAAWRER